QLAARRAHRELAGRHEPQLLAEARADRARVAAAARVVERLEREIERLREAGPRRDLPGRGREARVPDLDRVRQRGQAQRRGGDRLAAAVDPDLRLRRLARDLDLAVLRG